MSTTKDESTTIRIAKACSACSRQKLRCDGANPCARCQSIGGVECVYLPSMRGKIKRKRKQIVPLEDMTQPVRGDQWQSKESKCFNDALFPSQSDAYTPMSGSAASPVTKTSLDKLTTTLPLDGDAHNPLAVLVELSEAASDRAFATGRRRQREEDEYYAPLERTLKEEAPQIMSLINAHEYYPL